MGAYYTKEDITEYIGKNTIIPFLFDRAKEGCAVAFQGDSEPAFRNSVWALPQADPDRYIYEAMGKGTKLSLPDDIAVGLDDMAARALWNTPTPADYALTTEIWRETVARRQRYEEVRTRLAAGEIRDVNDFITYNLDIRQFAQDVVEQAEGPDLLAAFWRALTGVSVLDPTCGSGAFLFAALNILEPLYEAAIARMREFVADPGWPRLHPRYTERFGKVLDDIARHPNETYFIHKSIIVNNLYGVDIMAEAVEIARLRLFLKLASQVEQVEDVEPLPDIDFNIRTGNTLVGYVKREEVREGLTVTRDAKGGEQRNLLFGETQDALAAVEEKAADIDRLYNRFRAMQTGDGEEGSAADLAATKAELLRRLAALNDELDRALARQYGVGPDKPAAFRKWRESHQPFHWFTEFYGILHGGGFDVVIGNPPYVVSREIIGLYSLRNYQTEDCGNLYAYTFERSISILDQGGRVGLIIPVASICTDGFASLRNLLRGEGALVVSSFNDRPGKLFDGLEHIRLSVIFLHKTTALKRTVHSTKYNKWATAARHTLFSQLTYGDVTHFVTDSSIPKIALDTEGHILERLLSEGRSVSDYLVQKGNWQIFYTRKLSGFVQILDFIPTILDAQEKQRNPSELKVLHFDSEMLRNVLLALLNSSLFYWWLTIRSDCRNLNLREIESMPFRLEAASSSTLSRLDTLAQSLTNQLKATSQMQRLSYRDLGQLTIQLIYPKKAKRLIDQIDQTLAAHYGFTEAERDFIINYDIKYRMGEGLFEEGEDV